MPSYVLGVTPTWIFTPTTGLPNTVQLYNSGESLVYVGNTGVTMFNGFPIQPGQKVTLPAVTSTLYGVSGVAVGTTSATVNSVAATAGSTTLTIGSGIVNFPAGTTFVLGWTSSNKEVLVVASTASNSVMTVTTPLLHGHGPVAPLTAATSTLIGQLTVISGVL